MKKFIHADKAMLEKLKAIFMCSDKTIRNALSFNQEKGNSALCKKIRFTALQNGCHTYTVVDESECFHDESDRLMWCLCRNGAQASFNKITGEAEIIYKGEVVARYENVQLTDINAIRQRAETI